MFRDFKISDVALLLGLQLVKIHNNGVSIDYVCPFCGKKVFNINTKKDKFRCNACGVYGNSLTLYAQVEGVTNQEAYASLSEAELPEYYCNSAPITDTKAQERYVPNKELRALFGVLGLSESHKLNLLNRGLSDESIEKYGFKSVPTIGQSCIIKGIERSGVQVAKIPGVYKGISGEYELNEKRSGILIPSYYGGINGKLRGAQIRFDKNYKRKYMWLSATNMGGCSSGSPLTYLESDKKPEYLFVTEGILKAIIFHELTGYAVVGIAGVNNQSEIPKLLKETSAKYIFNIFDMDYLTNDNVKKAEAKLRETVRGNYKKYSRLVWDKTHKGIDDYLVATNDTGLKGVQVINTDTSHG